MQCTAQQPKPPPPCTPRPAVGTSLASTPGSAAGVGSKHGPSSGGATPSFGTSFGSGGGGGGAASLKPTAREFVPGGGGGASKAGVLPVTGFGAGAPEFVPGGAAGLKPSAAEFRPGQSGLSAALK